jgi:hypothetical protein
MRSSSISYRLRVIQCLLLVQKQNGSGIRRSTERKQYDHSMWRPRFDSRVLQTLLVHLRVIRVFHGFKNRPEAEIATRWRRLAEMVSSFG